MEAANVGFGPRRQGAIKMPSLLVRCAGRFPGAVIAAGCWGTVNGQPAFLFYQVQRETLSLRALVMIGIGVVLEAALGIPPRTLEVESRQQLREPCTAKHHDHIAQD